MFLSRELDIKLCQNDTKTHIYVRFEKKKVLSFKQNIFSIRPTGVYLNIRAEPTYVYLNIRAEPTYATYFGLYLQFTITKAAEECEQICNQSEECEQICKQSENYDIPDEPKKPRFAPFII